MKRSNVDSSTPDSSNKRGRLDEESVEGPPPDLLRYENYEQFKLLMDKSDFEKRLDHPSNEDIIHRIVAETRNACEKDIDGRKKVLCEIISKRLALLHNQVYDESHTPLHQPNVHVELIKFLIERGVPINGVTQPHQFTFLHIAAMYLNPDEFHALIAFLLKMGFNKLLKAKDCNGLTPIHLAVYNMELKKETILLCRDSGHVQSDFLNDIDVKGNNVLAYAVMGGRNEECLRLLQGLGAEPRVNSFRYSVLHHAAAYGNLDAIKLFGHGDHLYQEARGGLTPVHVALFSGRRNIHDVVKALVDRRKEYAIIPDNGGYTPLSWAQNGPLKEIIEPGTVELLQNKLAEFKSILNQGNGNSTTARGSAETTEGAAATAEVPHAFGQENVTPECEPEIEDVESNNKDSNSLASRINDKDEGKNKEIHGEALRVPLNDHDNTNQDVTPNASDAGEETEITVVPVELQNCNTESEGIVPETDIDEFETSDRCDANNNTCTSATSTKGKERMFSSSLAEETLVKGEENEIHGEAVQVPFDDHAIQDASSNAFGPGEQTRNSVVAGGSPVCNMELETPQNDSEPEIEVLSSSGGEDSSGSISDGTGAPTYTYKAIHNLVANSLGLSRIEVFLRRHQITKVLQSRAELLNMKVGDDEKTPLLCEKVHVDLLRYLIVKGADVSVTTKEKMETVLHVAANYLGPKQYHELVIIVQETNPSVLKALNYMEQLALHIACYKMDVKKETLIAFRDSGVNLLKRDLDLENLLSYAVKGGRPVKFIKTLWSLGLKSTKNKYLMTAVHYAARYRSLEVLKYVIDLYRREHLYALNSSNQSPLHYALSGGVITEEHVKITHALLHEYGMKDRLNVPLSKRDLIHCVVSDSVKCSPEEINRRIRIIDMLVECDNTLLNVLIWPCRSTPLGSSMVHADLLKYLIRKGCDPRHQGAYKNTFLHQLGKRQFSPEQYHDLIILLIQNGYTDELTMKNDQGRTPLHEAVWNIELKEETIEVFKTHGGLNQVDNRGENIICAAARGGRSLSFVKMLMNKGGMDKHNLRMIHKGKTSAAHLAAGYGDLKVLEYFLKLKPKLAIHKNGDGKTPLYLALERAMHKTKRLEAVKNLLLELKVSKVLTQYDVQKLVQEYINAKGPLCSKKEREELLKTMGELSRL